MPYISRKSRRNILLFLAALLCAFLVSLIVHLSHTTNVATFLYSALIFIWLMSARRRILSKSIRRCLMLGAALLILLLCLREFRYEFLDRSPLAARTLWYAYYIPFTAVPLCSFCAALCVGKEEGAKPLRRAKWLWAVCAFLVAAILTNDLHGAMFRIEGYESSETYGYGFLYYLTVLWCAGLTIAAFAILLHRCRLSQCRQYWYVPVAAALFGTALLVWYFIVGGSPTIGGVRLYLLQEAFAVLFIGFWESSIQIGLIPSNTDYDAIFERSPLDAFITDKTGRVVYRAADTNIPDKAALAAALDTSVFIDEDHILRSTPIRGGSSYWIEDISEINAINRQIASAIELLKEDSNLLAEENRIKAERTMYETQNKIYDSISPIVQPQLAEIRRLLADDTGDESAFQGRLLHAMLLSVYVKRRVNLALIAHNSPYLPVRELELAVHEAVEILSLRGVFVHVSAATGAEELPAAQGILAYDFFEEVLERSLPGLSAMLVELGGEGRFRLDLTMGTPTAQIKETWRSRQLAAQGGMLRLVEDDGSVHARLSFGEDGGTV